MVSEQRCDCAGCDDTEFTGDFHLAAEVIYCRRLRDDAYMVGLKFQVDGRV